MKTKIPDKIKELIRFILSGYSPFSAVLKIGLETILSLSSLFLFIHLTKEVLEKEFNTADILISEFIYSLRTPFLTKIMIFFTYMGTGFVLITAALIILFLVFRKHKKEAVLFLIILFMGFVMEWLLKKLIQRPRPDLSPLIPTSSYSFPSGHAMNSTLFYLTLSYFIYHFTGNKKMSLIVLICSIVIIGLIGFSRVYLGVHYPSDILGGYIAGFWLFITVILIDKTMNFYKLFKKSE